jgi:hypothetical protein
VTDANVLTDEIRAFVDAHLRSVAHLELLFLLSRTPDKQWSAPAAGAELGLQNGATASMLEELGSKGICDVRLGQEVLYRFAPANDELRQIIDKVIRARLAVVAHIFSKGPSSIRDLADAFRIKGK